VHAVLGPDGVGGETDFTCADSESGATLSFSSADAAHVDRCRREGCVLNTVKVPHASLNDLLAGMTDRVDVLSLDVEGMELDVLRGFDVRRFAPQLVLVEEHDEQRDAAVAEYLRVFGYEAAARKGCNLFFVAPDMRRRLDGLLYPSERISGRP